MATVSVIIPCYNQGIYVSETVDSVLAQTYEDLEIIIVNDGSTDYQTNTILKSFNLDKTKIITTTNQGLAAARNNGISVAEGAYILPLDADDRIAPSYIEQAVQVLDSEPDVGIVYCHAMLFGAVDCDWNLPPYSLEEMLKDNVIFCSALFRRKDWQIAGGYDPGMIYGWEDYDFWLSLIERGRKVRQLDGRLFYYRVASDSMVRSKEKWQKIEMFERIYNRHREFIGQNIKIWIEKLMDSGDPYYTSRLYVDTGNGFNEDESFGRKVMLGVNHVIFDMSQFQSPLQLRFDPIDSSACVRVDKVVLTGTDKSIGIDIEALPSNSCCQAGNVFMFSDRDPHIIIPLSEQKQIPPALEITFTITSVAEQSLREIIEFLRNQQSHSGKISGKIVDWWRTQRTGQR